VSRWFRSYGFQLVYDNLVVGAVPADYDDVAALEFIGIDTVLNLVEDDEYELGAHELVSNAYDDAGIEEQRIAIVDYGHLPPAALDAAVDAVNQCLDDGRMTYVHCRAGWQRSAAVAAAVVATRERLDVDEAVRLVRSRKPSADPLPHQREDLRRWWQARQPADAS
jgi:protein-tyrosine phosphatase